MSKRTWTYVGEAEALRKVAWEVYKAWMLNDKLDDVVTRLGEVLIGDTKQIVEMNDETEEEHDA
mgnify:CR=1 FL=1